MLRFRSLGSGSSGNATLVECSSATISSRLLIDCGLGLRQLDQRMAEAGLRASDLDAIFITHEHGDHIGCAVAVARREGLPVWMSHGTYLAIGSPDPGSWLRIAADSQPIACGEIEIRPFTVPHDAREPLQLVCTDGARRLGVLTDLGHATSHVLDQLAGCQALLLESNHDAALLEAGRYPLFLKRRVGGLWGHLSNAAASDIARQVHHPGLRHVVAAHLSEQNNSPDLAREALAGGLGCAPGEILVAAPTGMADWLNV